MVSFIHLLYFQRLLLGNMMKFLMSKRFAVTDVTDCVIDDLTFYRPTWSGCGLEVDQVQRSPQTQNWTASVEVDEQLSGA